jgi:hypothetical protein
MDAFSCPRCAVRLMVPEDLAGEFVACPECATLVPVPAAEERADAVRRGAPMLAAVGSGSTGSRSAGSSFDGLPERPSARSIATPVDVHDFLPRDPTDNGRIQPWRVGRWIGTGGAIVFGGAAVLLLCVVQGYRQITAAANAAVKPPVAFPRPALVIPPPPVWGRPVGNPRPAEAPRPPEPVPAPIVIGAGG